MGKIKKVGKHFLGYKTGQYWDYKLGQVLGITNRGKRDFKSEQVLQIGAEQFSCEGEDIGRFWNMH